MKNEINKLVLLAQVDAEIDTLIEQKEELPQAIIVLEKQMKDLDNSLESRKRELESLTQEKKKKESDIVEKTDWVRERQGKFKKNVTNSREFGASQREVSLAKKHLEELEASVQKLAVLLEEMGPKITESEQSFTDQKTALEAQIQDIAGKIPGLDSQIEEKNKIRQIAQNGIPEGLLNRYNTLRKSISTALSKAESGICDECNTKIPPQMFIEIQKWNQIISCPRCHRILYLVD